MSVCSFTVVERIRKRGSDGIIGLWREMSIDELRMLREVQHAQEGEFVGFAAVQPPLLQMVGVLMANGDRKICEFDAAYNGETFQGSHAIGWLVIPAK